MYYFQEESSGNDIDSSAPSDSDLDAQLDSLRKKLSEVIMVLIVKFFIVVVVVVYLGTNFASGGERVWNAESRISSIGKAVFWLFS